MNGKQARAQRRATREEMARHLWDSSPLPVAEKIRLQVSAQYLTDRLYDRPCTPPAHWSAEQVAMFDAVLSSEDGRSAVLHWALDGWRQLVRETNAALAA